MTYDEFGLLAENAAELGRPDQPLPAVARMTTAVGNGQHVSAIGWGAERPDLIFLHGGGQNAHTWDTVLLALGRDALAIDLPGHGHSDWRADRDYTPRTNADSVAKVISRHARIPVTVIGMSLGGLTATSLAARHPELVRSLFLVDVTPASAARAAEMSQQQRGSVALVSGPRTFPDFETIAQAAVAATPQRDPRAVRRGVRHNAGQLADGRWAWRYDQLTGSTGSTTSDYSDVWDDLSATTGPIILVRGGDSHFVRDEDVTEAKRRRPELDVHTVDGSGHSVQSDQPERLVQLILSFLAAGG